MSLSVITPRSAAPAPAARLAAMLAEAVSHCLVRIRHELRVRADVARLNALDDHLLADMGFTRGEIARALRSGRER